LKYAIAAMLYYDIRKKERPRLEKKVRCLICQRSKDKKTYLLYPSWERPMCDNNRAYICVDYAGRE